MGTIPTPPTFVAGQTSGVAAGLNQLRDCINFWALTPRVYAYQSTTQSLPTNTFTAITFDSEVYDVVQSGDTASHDNTTNNTRLIARTPGKYEITGQVQIAANATGARSVQLRLNAAGNPASGTQIALNQQTPLASSSTSVSITPIEVQLSAGDYVEMFANQQSGGALNTGTGQGTTFLRMKLTGS